MKIFLSRLHFPVTTLGFGRRVGIWFQGCSVHCPGCVSHDTWAFGKGETTLEALCAAVEPWLGEADGVTISGGEPFDQPAALEALVRWLRPRVQGDVLVFSGYGWEELGALFERMAGRAEGRSADFSRLKPHLDLGGCERDLDRSRTADAQSRLKSALRGASGWTGLIDVLISEPYVRAAGQTLALRGSDNQRVHLLTALGRERYADLPTRRRDGAVPALDLVIDGETVWMAGIPGAGDLERLRQSLAEAGFDSGTSEAPPILA